MKRVIAGVMLALASAATAQDSATQETDIELWRLDCGSIDVDLSTFSDTGLYVGQRRTLAASCYLIRNGKRFLLWDTGLDGALAGKPKDSEGSLLKQRLVPQLARIGVKPNDVTFLGISHYHYDHTGQLADFPGATLVIGKKDMDVVRARDQLRPRFAPWLTKQAKVEEVTGDRDIFGDGRVTMLSMPGHTPGHSALLVRLTSGAVLLSGDEYHFREQIENRGVPSFNANRAETLASHDRFDRLAKNLRAKVILQHDTRDISKLPIFPNSAR